MIGFNFLGKMGRLGNQMFQYAALKGIADNRGFSYCIPPSKNQNEWRDHQLFNIFDLKCETGFINPERTVFSEKSFSFDTELFNGCPDGVSINGYFQSEKYFKHIKSEVKKDFLFKDDILNISKQLIENWKNPISLHVRRTDYFTSGNHTVLSMDYYEKSLSEFDDSSEVIIFSDDPQWCMSHKLFSSDRFMVSETKNSYIDLCLMTLCKGHIIANSSFSWWGAWLSDSEKVVAPLGWFSGSNNEHLDTKDLIPKDWTLL